MTDPRETAQRSGWRGKAFLVTSWASKKSLAKARRAGEKMSRAEPSCPMRRSRIERLVVGEVLD
ncbi:hypothetical protein E2P79_03870 [Aeromonas schubertii]|nr:hypothetical protein E2P79_03870 [Aeromonas schubertii]